MDSHNHHLTLEEGLQRLRGETYASLIPLDGAELGIYAPVGQDPQQPHDRDELYFVARGTGTFLNGETRTSFGPGDVLYVPAQVPHRFETFSEDFAVWVVFYGERKGG